MREVQPLGDRAWLIRFANEDAAAGWAAAARGAGWPGVVEIMLAYQSAAVFADPDRIDLDDLARWMLELPFQPARPEAGRAIRLPVLYDGADLAEVAAARGLTAGQVVALHSGQDYRVFALGFLPGFPYAGYLPEALAGLPRRASPRARVAAGSVAIAGRQTGVYPQESPGGWHLLGRTPLTIASVARGRFPIRAGDRLRFVPIDQAEFQRLEGQDL